MLMVVKKVEGDTFVPAPSWRSLPVSIYHCFLLIYVLINGVFKNDFNTF